MYPISSAVKALFDAEQRQVLRITGTDRNGASISITDADVLINGFNIDRYCCNGERLELGTAIAAQMTLRLDNRDGRFDGIVFEGTELFVETGIADWTQENPTINWIPQGYFTPDEQPRSYSNITLHCLDRMMRLDVTSPTLLPWTDNYGNQITDNYGNPIYFNAELAFPATVKATIEEIAVRCGMTISTDLTTLPNYDYVIRSLPVGQRTITYRTLVQWCAALMGTCAFVDWNGGLAFKWYEAVDYTATIENRFSSDLHENDITITGVSFTNLNDVEIVSGDADYTIDLTGNYLITNNESTLLPVINTAVNGFTYRPFSADVINAPYLWPMDTITFTDKDGNDYNCAVTNVNFGLNTYTALSGVGETDQANKGVAPSGLTRQQAQLIDSVMNVLDDSLDQQEIFNRLTNNGATRGIMLVNGQLYINADYIRSGTLVLGGENNVRGIMQLLDEQGNVAGTATKDGFTTSHVNSPGDVSTARIGAANITFVRRNKETGIIRSVEYTGDGTIGLDIIGPDFPGEGIRSYMRFWPSGDIRIAAAGQKSYIVLYRDGGLKIQTDDFININSETNITLNAANQVVIRALETIIRNSNYFGVRDNDGFRLVAQNGTVSMRSSGDASIYVTAGGDAEIRSTGGASTLILKSDGTVTINNPAAWRSALGLE
jgi:hypothetical protein